MVFRHFEENITTKYSIVVDRWPLPKFCSPSDIKSKKEVKVLFNTWSSGTTSFCRLSSCELEEWSNSRFESVTQDTSGDTVNSPGSL